MTVSEFIADGRRAIQDAVGTPRFADSVWINYVKAELRQLWGNHPEAFFVSAVLTEIPTLPAATDQDLPILDDYISALFHKVCARIMEENREAAANAAVSDAHYQKGVLET